MGPRKDDEVSVADHFKERLEFVQRIQEERWEAHKEVHAMGQRAIDSALVTLNIRLEGMNEFRAQILKERGDFVKQPVYDSQRAALEAKVDVQGKWIDNMTGRLWMLGAFILVINILVGFLFRLWGK